MFGPEKASKIGWRNSIKWAANSHESIVKGNGGEVNTITQGYVDKKPVIGAG